MVVFIKLPGIRSKSGIKRRCSMTSLDRRGLLCRGVSWEIKPCRRKILCSRKQYFPALEVDLEPQGLTVRVGKGGRRKLPFMAFFLPRWCGSLFTAVLGYDACKSGKNLFKRSWKRGKEQTETCPILMEQAPLQTRFGNDALLLGEKNCFFPKSQRLAEVIGENAQGAGKRLPGC